MSAYNVAITVGPNMFRPKSTRPEDITNVGSYYELIIQMIQQYDLLFDETVEYHHILQRAKDEKGNLLRKNLGADAGIGQINLDPLKEHLGLAGGAGKGEALNRFTEDVSLSDEEEKKEEKKEDDDDGDGDVDDDDGEEDIFAQMAKANKEAEQ